MERHRLLSGREELREVFRRTVAVFSKVMAVRLQLSVPCSMFTKIYGAFVLRNWDW